MGRSRTWSWTAANRRWHGRRSQRGGSVERDDATCSRTSHQARARHRPMAGTPMRRSSRPWRPPSRPLAGGRMSWPTVVTCWDWRRRRPGATYRHQRGRGELVASANLRLLYLVMPEWFAVRYWSRALRGDFGELAFAAHTRHAWGEMAALSEWLRSTLTDDPAALAALDRLLGVATDLNPSGDR